MIRDVSTALHAEASQHLVGGVNSPVRAFKSVHGDPLYLSLIHISEPTRLV